MNEYLLYLITGIGTMIVCIIIIIILFVLYFICFTFIENQVYKIRKKLSVKTERIISLIIGIFLWIAIITMVIVFIMLMGYTIVNDM